MSLLKIWLSLTALLASNSCGHVKISDHEFCGDKGTLGAHCVHFLTPETRNISKDAWDDERFGMICERPQVFADWKQTIEQLCSNSNLCDIDGKGFTSKNLSSEQKEIINKLLNQMNVFINKIEQIE